MKKILSIRSIVHFSPLSNPDYCFQNSNNIQCHKSYWKLIWSDTKQHLEALHDIHQLYVVFILNSHKRYSAMSFSSIFLNLTENKTYNQWISRELFAFNVRVWEKFFGAKETSGNSQNLKMNYSEKTVFRF